MKFSKLTKISILLILVGLYFRVYHLFSIGYYFDIIETQYIWGKAASEMGILNFWRDYNGFFDYMPLSVVLEFFIYNLANLFGDSQYYFNFFLKLFNLLIDALLSIFIFYLPNLINIKTIETSKRLLISSIVFCIPSIWFISNVWGQNDSLIVLLGLISVSLLFTKPIYKFFENNSIYSGIILAFSFWIKQQAILFIPIIYIYLIITKKFKQILQFTIGLTLSSVFISLPFLLVNSQRLQYILQTVSNRAKTTTNGASNLWVIINKIGDSSELKVFNISIDTFSKILLIISGLLCTYLFFKNIQKNKKNLTLVIENVYYFLMLICFSYFLFATKIHSRYLHISIIVSILLLIFQKNFKNKLFLFSVFLVNIGYTVNQIVIYNGYEKNIDPKWAKALLDNYHTPTLSLISSWMILSSYIIFLFIKYKQINEDQQ